MSVSWSMPLGLTQLSCQVVFWYCHLPSAAIWILERILGERKFLQKTNGKFIFPPALFANLNLCNDEEYSTRSILNLETETGSELIVSVSSW